MKDTEAEEDKAIAIRTLRRVTRLYIESTKRRRDDEYTAAYMQLIKQAYSIAAKFGVPEGEADAIVLEEVDRDQRANGPDDEC